MAVCETGTARDLTCRDGRTVTVLKLVSMLVIFATSLFGISGPVLLARMFHGKPVYDKAILVIKCFAAGVIISTSLVHVLPNAFTALSNCQVASHHPWKDFPFSGFITLIGVLTALLVDLTATSYVENNSTTNIQTQSCHYTPIKFDINEMTTTTSRKTSAELGERVVVVSTDKKSSEEEEVVKMKQRIVSQVLQIGIIFHSVIIGVTMGMSQNQCTIKPLVAALAFHQIFEGMGLGGCVAQAGFNIGTTTYMCLTFAATIPTGIILGMIIFYLTGYDASSSHALILEGLLGSLSSGILIYMGLVDLIALDFFHNKVMNSESWLKKGSFIALVLGSMLMSILALWE